MNHALPGPLLLNPGVFTGNLGGMKGEKMGKRLERTPRSQIRSALRRLFLRSRERSSVMRRDKYTCVECKAKQSKAKGREIAVECHHLNESRIDHITDLIQWYLLCDPTDMQCLCKKCHDSETERQRREQC